MAPRSHAGKVQLQRAADCGAAAVQEYALIDLRDVQSNTRLLGGEAMHVSEFDDRALAGRERVYARADLTLCLFGQEPVIWPVAPATWERHSTTWPLRRVAWPEAFGLN